MLVRFRSSSSAAFVRGLPCGFFGQRPGDFIPPLNGPFGRILSNTGAPHCIKKVVFNTVVGTYQGFR